MGPAALLFHVLLLSLYFSSNLLKSTVLKREKGRKKSNKDEIENKLLEFFGLKHKRVIF